MATNNVPNLSNLLRLVRFNGNIRCDGTNSVDKSIVSSDALSSRNGSDARTDDGDNSSKKKRSFISSDALSSRNGSDASSDDRNNSKKKKQLHQFGRVVEP